MYTETELVRIAKRENNNKRRYLVINRLQGKHIPVSPSAAFHMFDALADTISSQYQNERLLLIGFAETATAIGAALSIKLNTYYMQTTREIIPNVEYLFFSEAHSHAAEQKLIKTDLNAVIGQTDRIIFVEDEVTTGNTILNIIDLIVKTYDASVSFSVASLLNGMDETSLHIYDARNIPVHYLVKTEHSLYTEIADSYIGNGEYHICHGENCLENPQFKELTVTGCINARRLTAPGSYQKACAALFNNLKEYLDFPSEHSVLVIGTEEFMYPALYTALQIEKRGNTVRCHSTTRSPIMADSAPDYPLHARYELCSLYDRSRKIFLYDIKTYDKVLILTDADNSETDGIHSLISALASQGNQDITFIRWC